MNKRYYRNYKNTKMRWYLVSYKYRMEDGTTGNSGIELQIAGNPNWIKMEKFIITQKQGMEGASIINVIPTQKNRSK